MLDVRGVQVKPVTTTMPITVVVIVVENGNWLTEVDGDHRAPRDRGPCSRRGPRRRLSSGTAVVSFLPVAFVPGMSLPISNLVHTTALSSMVIMPPMDFLHRDFGQAEMTALAGPSWIIQVRCRPPASPRPSGRKKWIRPRAWPVQGW